MSFEDLPDDWLTRPVDDPEIVDDVLDLAVFIADRERGALAVLMCDDEHRLVQPVMVSDAPRDVPPDERARAVGVFVEALGHGSLLLAIARREGLSITDDDRDWAVAALRACGDEVRFLGLHVVTVGGSRLVPLGEAAA
jgi:hypothetical protein